MAEEGDPKMPNLVQGRQVMEKSGNLWRGQLRQLCSPPQDCTPSGDLSPLSREPPPSPMVKKQRRKKLTTPSKTEGSAGQAEGEALVGSFTLTVDPHPQTPGLVDVTQEFHQQFREEIIAILQNSSK